MGNLRIALIGTGNMGRKYAEMITQGKIKGLELTCAVCRSDDALKWGRELGGFNIARSAEELFAKPDGYDAVLVVTPHKTHPELVMRAFSLGKAVLCDKPVAIDVQNAVKMYKTAEEKGLTYAVMHHHRLRPEYALLKKMISGGEFGTIHSARMVCTRFFRTNAYHHSSPWRSTMEGEGGGALINQGQHPIDIWQWLFGVPDEVESLVMTGKYNDFDVEDEATVLMKYKSGMTGSFMISTAEGYGEERLVISGSKKSAVLDGESIKIVTFGEDTDEYRQKAGVHSSEELKMTEEIITPDKVSNTELYINMLQNFTDSVLNGASPVSSGNDIGALIITNAAYLSEKEKRRVKVDEVKRQ